MSLTNCIKGSTENCIDGALRIDPSIIDVDINSGSGAYSIFGGPYALVYSGDIYLSPIRADGSEDVEARRINISSESITDDKIVRNTTQHDDHNMASVLIRPVEGELVLVSTDHATAGQNNVYYFRGTDLDPDNLPGTATVTVVSSKPTYGNIYVNPSDRDQVDNLLRLDGANVSDWRIHRSEDFDAGTPTVNSYPIFKDSYVDAIPAKDGSGNHVICSPSPQAHKSGPTLTTQKWCQKLTHWFIGWDDTVKSKGVSEGDITTITQFDGQGNNFLDYSNGFDVGWDQTNCPVTTSTTANRHGATGVSVRKLRETTNNSNHRRRQEVPCIQGKTYEAYCWAKAGEVGKIMLYGPAGSMVGHVSGDDTDPRIKVDLSDGSIIEKSNNLLYSEVYDNGDGWYLILFIFIPEVTISSPNSWYYIFLVDTDDSTIYSGTTGFGLYVDDAQYAETVYTDREQPYNQNLVASNKPTTAEPMVLYNAPRGKYIRMMGMHDDGTRLCVLFCLMDTPDGSDYANSKSAKIYYMEYNLTSHAVTTPVAVDHAGDGMDDNTMTYVDGDVIGRNKVIYDRQNYFGNGEAQIVVAESSDGTYWEKKVAVRSDTGKLLRPKVVREITDSGGDLRYSVTDWFTYIDASVYDGYTTFTSDVHVAKLN